MTLGSSVTFYAMTPTAWIRASKRLLAALTAAFGLLLCFAAPVLGQSTSAAGTSTDEAGSVVAARYLRQEAASPASVLRPIPLAEADREFTALDRTVSVHLRDGTVEEALRLVSNEADLELAYLRSAVAVEKRVTLSIEQASARETLGEIVEGTGLRVMVLPGTEFIWVEDKTPGPQSAPTDLKHTQGQAGTVQTGTITGTVTDSLTGEPLPGVNVVLEGTTQGAATSADGQYTISEVEAGTYTVTATFIGYDSESRAGVRVRDGDDTVVDFALGQTQMGLDELVVVGYGTQQRRNLTGSVGSINAAEQVETQPVTSAGQLLQGRVPGLNAGVATGTQGETNLQVRGQNSIQAGNNPLIVVDGMRYQGSLSDINPSDIQSIDVLKGASAAAVYGASAAAGVVEVTTKTGTTPEPTVQFRSSLGMATPGNITRPYEPEAYVRMRRDMAIRQFPDQPEHYYADPRNLPSGITLEEWEGLGTGGGEPVRIWLGRLGLAANEIQNYMEGGAIDWHDQVYRDAALRQNYNISVSGNPEAVSYYLSLGYTDNEGQVVGDRFQTVRARANVSSTVTDWLEVSLKSQYANRNEGYLEANDEYVQYASPYGDMYAEDGTLNWYPHGDVAAYNPFLWTTQSGRGYEWQSNSLLGNLSAEVSLPYGLDFQVRWTNDLNFRRAYNFIPSTVPQGEPAGRASRGERTDYRWQIDNILTWDQTFAGIHAFDATFLFNAEAENIWNTTANSDQFPLENLGYGGLPLGTSPTVENDDLRATGTALMGRLNYRLLDRYLVTVSLRRDGYSAFGQSHPHAYFPSAAFAWRLSEEPFFDVDPVSNLKLRLSWGRNGNRDIGTYAALQRLNTVTYPYGTELATGISAANLPNPGLQWESTSQYNAGLDFGLLDGRLSGSLDAYYMSTENLLLNRSLPEITGYANVISNLGEVVNRGIELSLTSSNVQREQFAWNSTLNFSLNRNEIKALYGDGEDDRQNGWFIGHSLSEIYDYEILGVWQEGEAEEAAVYGKEPGDFKLRDVNDDGALTPVEDRTFQGYTDPRFRVSLINEVNYRRFTASALLNAHIGQYAAHNAHLHTGWQYGRANQLDYPYWTPENPTNEWARLSSVGDAPVFNYWERTSFLRLQNLSVSYEVPERLTDRVSAQSLRLFLNAQNVFTLTGFEGADPETQELTPRLYSVGLNLSF